MNSENSKTSDPYRLLLKLSLLNLTQSLHCFSKP